MDSPDSAATFIRPSPVVRESRPHRARAARRSRLPLALILVLAAAAAIAAGVFALGGSNGAKGSSDTGSGAVVALTGVTAYDPYGSGGEHDADAAHAADGDSSTYWSTEHYSGGLGKQGVGVVLDAGAARTLKTVTVRSDTPGFTAMILTGSSSSGPFVSDSAKQTVGARATFELAGKSGRYVVVWITDLGANSAVHVNDVTARG
jgi:hypothetical protein